MTIIPLILTCLISTPAALAPVTGAQVEMLEYAVYEPQADRSDEQTQARLIACIESMDAIEDAAIQIAADRDGVPTQITLTLTAAPGHSLTDAVLNAVKRLSQDAWANQATPDIRINSAPAS